MLSVLFQEGIYQIQENEVADSVNFYGNNLKNIAFLVNNSLKKFTSSPALDSLGKILVALKLDFDDVAVFSTADFPQLSLQEIVSILNPKQLILMGSDPIDSSDNPNHPPYSIYFLAEAVVMKTPSFDEIIISDEKKREFWSAIKKLMAGN